jgi:hypothetical protein
MPFLSIKRKAALETRKRTQRFSLSTQKRRYCRLGMNRRRVLLWAWETLFPDMGFLPVTSHTFAMIRYLSMNVGSLRRTSPTGWSTGMLGHHFALNHPNGSAGPIAFLASRLTKSCACAQCLMSAQAARKP